MEIRLLKNGYKKSEQFYNDFLEDQIRSNDDYFSGDVVYIDEVPDFPIYMGRGSESENPSCFSNPLAFNESIGTFSNPASLIAFFKNPR